MSNKYVKKFVKIMNEPKHKKKQEPKPEKVKKPKRQKTVQQTASDAVDRNSVNRVFKQPKR